MSFFDDERIALNLKTPEDVGVGFSCIICGGIFCGYPRCSTVPICNDCLLSLKSLIKTEEHTVRKGDRRANNGTERNKIKGG